MTSSLVGSEMCIRDRDGAPGDGFCRRGCQSGRKRRHGEGGGTLEHVPVSYTHLTLPTICSV
eukprot:888721-Prorocentrum_lima.AAC.1